MKRVIYRFETLNTCPGLGEHAYLKKLDRVGPVDERQSFKQPHHFVRRKKLKYATHEKLRVTRDIRHMTRDMLHMLGV